MLAYRFTETLKTMPFVEAIYLYGSRARGDYLERSDIDLAIVCPKASGEDWLKIMDIIEQADTLLSIDCVRYDMLEAASQLKQNIDHDKKVLYVKSVKSL